MTKNSWVNFNSFQLKNQELKTHQSPKKYQLDDLNTDLDFYSSNSGSPVFCAETHELLGIVSRRKAADFRWTEEGWMTLRYPKADPDYKGSQCSRASEFGKLLK
ncbi:MAG TPA: hypothetical protein VK469_05705 [Candidatus Kapabacteria bacterium]|nr:hypothetical protein [Candidatus Kapabacteria bacterium]